MSTATLPPPAIAASRRFPTGLQSHGLLPPSRPPRTALGAVARNLSDQSTVSALHIAVTTAYALALAESTCPDLAFDQVPPGMPQSSLKPLQAAYNSFQAQFQQFSATAAGWAARSGGQEPLLAQLQAVPQGITNMKGTVSSNFALLGALDPSNPEFSSILDQQQQDLQSQIPAVQGLVTALDGFTQTLTTAAQTLQQSAQTGLLSQLTAAYQTDIAKFSQAITSADSAIANYNSQLSSATTKRDVAIAAAAVGAANWWNPVGWGLMAGGGAGIGAYESEINSLNTMIAGERNNIQTYSASQDKDQQAALLVTGLCTLAQQFVALSQASQAEIAALVNLLTTLGQDLQTAVSDLTPTEWTEAEQEWSTIMNEATLLENVTVYTWPSPTLLSNPQMFAAAGSNVYCLSVTGAPYSYSTSSGGDWVPLPGTALSIITLGAQLVGIDGAPYLATAGGAAPTSSYQVKTLDASTNTWTTISTFPVAAIAAGTTALYAIGQEVSERQVKQYSGQGTQWTALAALPGPDAAAQIAVANNIVFALSNNSRFVYQYNDQNQTWTALSNLTFASITGNGTKLGLVGTDNTQYLYDPTVGGAPAYTGWKVMQVAQLPNGDQYAVNLWNDIWQTQPDPLHFTFITHLATAVFASAGGAVYYADNEGNLYSISPDGSKSLLTALP